MYVVLIKSLIKIQEKVIFEREKGIYERSIEDKLQAQIRS